MREATQRRSRRIPCRLVLRWPRKGVLSMRLVQRQELLDRPVRGLKGMGSFDCMAVRFANGNSAQDDSAFDWFPFTPMHANPQRLQFEEPGELPSLRQVALGPTLWQRMFRFLRLLRLPFWRAFPHDAFTIPHPPPHSSILTFFPGLLVVGSLLATWRKGAPYRRQISYALSCFLPAGTATAMYYLRGAAQRPVGLLITASLLSLWTPSGLMLSWRELFPPSCYLP